MKLPELWSDSLTASLLDEWVIGSYCDRLMDDIADLKQFILAIPPVNVDKCKGCRYAPYDSQFGTCRTCIKHTKHEPEAKPLVRWFRIYDSTTWETQEEAEGYDSVQHKVIKLVPENK